MYLPESLPRLNPIKGSAQIKEAILTIKASVNTEHQFTEYLDGLDTMIYDSLSDIADDSFSLKKLGETRIDGVIETTRINQNDMENAIKDFDEEPLYDRIADRHKPPEESEDNSDEYDSETDETADAQEDAKSDRQSADKGLIKREGYPLDDQPQVKKRRY